LDRFLGCTEKFGNLSTENPVSIIIPTIRKESPTQLCAEKLGVETVVVHDPWRNQSRASNYGALLARGETLVFLDDDITFDPDLFWGSVSKVRDGHVVWNIQPLMVFITRKDFLRAGGFDERIRPQQANDTELWCRLQSLGVSIEEIPYGTEYPPRGIIHHGGAKTKWKFFLDSWNLMYVHMKYNKPKLLLRIFLTRNPVMASENTLSRLDDLPPFRIAFWFMGFYYWSILAIIRPRSRFFDGKPSQ